MSDFPPRGKYRITAIGVDGHPVVTLRQDGEDQPIKYEALESGNDEQLWYFDPLAGRDNAYYIRNVKYPRSYIEFQGEPADKTLIVSRSAAYHWWELGKIGSANSFSVKVADQSASYYVAAGSGYQLDLDTSGYYNWNVELVLGN